jgi:hypothetical protein
MYAVYGMLHFVTRLQTCCNPWTLEAFSIYSIKHSEPLRSVVICLLYRNNPGIGFGIQL